jgi:hypothetical protein
MLTTKLHGMPGLFEKQANSFCVRVVITNLAYVTMRSLALEGLGG